MEEWDQKDITERAELVAKVEKCYKADMARVTLCRPALWAKWRMFDSLVQGGASRTKGGRKREPWKGQESSGLWSCSAERPASLTVGRQRRCANALVACCYVPG